MLLPLLVSTLLYSSQTIVKNGSSSWHISVEAGAPASALSGALEIQSYVEKISGCRLPITTVKRWKRTSKCIAITDRKSKLGVEGFSIISKPGEIEITGGGPRGVFYGCDAFLEDVLGVHWYTASITVFPKKSTITVPALHMSQAPAFEYREPYYTEAFGKEWAAHNRCNGNAMQLDDSVGGKVTYGRFVHTFSELVSPEKYFATHPEYFSLVNGKRQSGYAQLCLTNPDVLKIAIDQVRTWIQQNPTATIFSVSQNDTYYNCQCDNCKKIEQEEGSPSGPLLRFVNQVADAIGKDYPNVLIDTLAYQWSEKPPQHEKPHKNVRVRLAPIGACVAHPLNGCKENLHPYENLRDWSRITNQLYIWHYSTNFANYLQPLPDLYELAGDMSLFKRSGVVGVFYEGDYAPGGGGEMSELKAYLLAKLMWNPDRPVQPIIDGFLNGVYGKAAPFIKEWLVMLHAPTKDGVHAFIYDPPGKPYLSAETLREGSVIMDRAGKAVEDDPVALEQVRKARLWVDYARLTGSSWHYTVVNGQYRPESSPWRDAMAKHVVGEIKHFGIGQVREGEPIESFEQRLGQSPEALAISTLETDRLRVDVAPAAGGRIVRLIDKKSGKNLLREGAIGEDGGPFDSGYEEYTGSSYRSPGWNEAYQAQSGGSNALVLSAKVHGLAVTRTLKLSGGMLEIESTAKNVSDHPLDVTLRTHPEFDVLGGSVEAAGQTYELNKPIPELFIPASDLEGWTLKTDGVSVIQEFRGAVQLLLNYYPDRHQLNMCLYGKSAKLEPGQETTLKQTWTMASR